ncbi:AAA family ATPase [Moraxella oblonga]|uniref:AAA family ATPase n=1 Tax=Moraxella oblonga TaxID=200413 RepID=UPI000830F1B5|nr:AAA family ATPase [Moraxella oblonga]
MKILNLSLKNLNALKGDWHIDFTDPVFDDGIFAIVGNTGAGKTTILDAICLAIYGRTPRLSGTTSISQTHNEIMSLDTGECLAQVELAIHGKIYRFRWEQARANKKATGKLQPIKRQISELAHPYDDNGTILQTKYCDKLAVEILGIKFEQFTRSVMLAQGDFSAFLRAEPSEKSEILEQITGTNIYSDIGKQTFLIHKQKENALNALKEKLGEMSILSDDEFGILNDTLDRQNKTLYNQKAQMTTLDDEILTHKELLRLNNDIHHLTTLLTELNQKLPTLKNTLNEHATKKDQAQTHLAKVRSEHSTIMATLREVQKLDNHIENTQKTHQKLSFEHGELTQKITSITHAIATTQTKINTLQQTLGKLTQTATVDLANTKTLFDNLTALATQLATLRHLYDNIKNHHTLTTKLYHDIHAKREDYRQKKQGLDELHKQKNQIIHQLITTFGLNTDTVFTPTVFDDVAQILTLIHQKITHQSELHTAQTELTQLTDSIHAKQTTLNQHTQTAHDIQQKIPQHEKLITSLEQNLTLFHELSALKKHAQALADGTPCPLCGSTTHPNKSDPHAFDDSQYITVTQNLATAKTELAQLYDTLKHHEIQTSSLQSELKYLHDQHQTTTQNTDILCQTIHAINEQIDTFSTKIGINPANITTQNAIEHHALCQTLKSTFDDIQAQITTLQQTMHGIENEGKYLRETHDIHQRQLHDLIEHFFAEQTQIHQIIYQHQMLQNMALGLDLPNLDSHTHFDEFVGQFFIHSDDYLAKLNHIINTLTTAKNSHDELGVLHIDLAHLHSQKSDWGDKANQLHQELHTTHSELTTLKAQRHALFGDQDPAVAQQNIDNEQNNAEANHINAVLAYDEIDKQVREINIAIKQYSEQQHKFTDTRTQMIQRLDKNMLSNFDDNSLIQNYLDELNAQKHTLQDSMDTLLQEIGKNTQIKTNNEKAKYAQIALRDEIQIAQRDFAVWDKLNALIGSSKGHTYRVFAQGLTLDLLLYHANQALATMNERYILCTDKDNDKTALHIYVIDTAQGNEMRSTKNLSGGESFIISLALAIGLSMMNSDKVSIDSLFLDEGFGTLDDDTLDIALATLSALHTNGKMIGIISHVFALKEQIGTQIIVKKGSNGTSTLSGAGVRKIMTRP